MSYVAECETCGIIERGDLEEVGDAAEDHEQFHDVRVQRVATDGSGHVCDACGETFRTLTRLRLHEKEDCPERATFDQIDPDAADADHQAAEGLLTCRNCGRGNPNADFEETTSFADSDYHLIVEFDCRHCGFENENRVVMTGVDRDDLARLPPHLQPDEIDGDLMTDGGRPAERTLEDAAEPAIVATCEACDGRLIEYVVAHHDDRGSVQLVCQDCDTEVRIEYEIGSENPWEKAAETDGVTDATVKDVAWVDCDRCHGHGRVEDPICDLRRAMNGREHPCPDCSASGKVPRVVETDGGRDQDDTGFFVVNEDRGAVVAGLFHSKEGAAEDARDRGPSHIVATEAVLEMIALTSSTTIRWKNDDVDVVTDGGVDYEAFLGDTHHLFDICNRQFDTIDELANHHCVDAEIPMITREGPLRTTVFGPDHVAFQEWERRQEVDADAE
jgi:hypothetical protein